jgi:sugar phosphate isomerase/epimerase
MENMFDSDPVILQKISEQLCVYSNFGVCLDYAHAHLSDTPIEEWIKALRQYIRHIHINDNDLRRDLHLAVGDGRIDWELFCRYYQTYFEECSVLIETTKPDNQRRSLEYLRKKL